MAESRRRSSLRVAVLVFLALLFACIATSLWQSMQSASVDRTSIVEQRFDEISAESDKDVTASQEGSEDDKGSGAASAHDQVTSKSEDQGNGQSLQQPQEPDVDGHESDKPQHNQLQDGTSKDRATDSNDSSDEGLSKENTTDTHGDEDGEQHAQTVVVGTALAQPGDVRVAVPIELTGNPGVLGMAFTVSYDESALALVDARSGDAFSGVLAMTRSRDLRSGCRFVWDGVDLSSGDVRDGAVLTLYFDVSSEASGSYAIAVRGIEAYDAQLEELSFVAMDGNVVVG